MAESNTMVIDHSAHFSFKHSQVAVACVSNEAVSGTFLRTWF